MKGLQKLIMCSAILGLALADVGPISVKELQLERCLGKNGVFLPIPGSCTQYLICVEGTGIISTCGQNHFDAQRGVCDLPSRAGCISTLPDFVDYLCLGLMDGTKQPVSGSSSQYYVCSQGKAVIKTCESLQFDEVLLQCKELPPVKPTVSPCFGVANGMRLPVAGSDRQYYMCMNNKAFLKDCGNMYFDVKYSVCVRTLEKESTKKVEEPVVEPVTTHAPQEFALCQNQRLGARVARPDSCSEYFICMGHTAVPKSCGANQFNPITTLCDQPSIVRCTVKANGLTYGTQNSNQLPAAAPTDVNVCSGQRDGIFVAAPGQCSDFFFCFRNKSFRKTCGKDNHFSPITMSCVELEESNCVDAHPAAVDVEVPVNSCLGRENGVFLKHPKDCGRFLVCDNNKSVEMDCPAGLHFNLAESYCDWPENAKCF